MIIVSPSQAVELESWMSEFCFASRSGSEFRHIGHYFYVNDLDIARLT